MLNLLAWTWVGTLLCLSVQASGWFYLLLVAFALAWPAPATPAPLTLVRGGRR